MEPDPIAENQTDVTIATLMTRADGDPLMNRAVASVLAYTKRLGAEMAEIKASLWSPDALDRMIATKHKSACGECEVRKWMLEHQRETKDQETRKPSLWSFLLSERGLLVIVVIIVTLAYARLTLGQQGYRDVMQPVSERIPK